MARLWYSGKYVLMYLGAIIAANLIITRFGAGASIVTAAIFIGLDLTSRDKLHEIWHQKGLLWKMALLIATGSVISWLANRGTARIAIASFVAFCIASTVDAAVYHLLIRRHHIVKINGSNVPSALVDSLIFPMMAFGLPVLWWVVLGQFLAKVGGGLLWSLVLHKTGIATKGLTRF